jgi:hypothetical protein
MTYGISSEGDHQGRPYHGRAVARGCSAFDITQGLLKSGQLRDRSRGLQPCFRCNFLYKDDSRKVLALPFIAADRSPARTLPRLTPPKVDRKGQPGPGGGVGLDNVHNNHAYIIVSPSL